MKVALYARVSSDRQDVDLSIAAQLKHLRDYAARNGHVVIKEFVDEAESACAVATIDLDAIRKTREELQHIQCRQPQVYRNLVRKY